VEKPDALNDGFDFDSDVVYIVWSYEVIRQMKGWGFLLIHSEVDDRLLGMNGGVRALKAAAVFASDVPAGGRHSADGVRARISREKETAQRSVVVIRFGRRRVRGRSGARATKEAAKRFWEIERVHSRVRMGNDGGKAWAGEVVAKIVVAVNERQRDVERKQRIAAGRGMLAQQNQGKAKIVKQLQENIIVSTAEVVRIKIPAPGSAENG